jgi:multiple sugar transport system ATP-binding protein
MQIVAQIGSHEIICVFRERIAPRPGDMIHIMPNPTLVHIFDEQTGKRL